MNLGSVFQSSGSEFSLCYGWDTSYILAIYQIFHVRFVNLEINLISDNAWSVKKEVLWLSDAMIYEASAIYPFKRQPHKMVKHTQTIRR